MHRRAFLRTTAILPVWLAAVAGAQHTAGEGPPERRAALRAAWEEARRSGRALLVLVIPPPELRPRSRSLPLYPSGQRRVRGLAWGQVFQHGTDEVLADLSLCVVACATLEEVRDVLPVSVAAAGGADPLLIVADPDLGCVQGVELALEPIPSPGWSRDDELTRYERRVHERIAAIGASLRAALAPTDEVLARRAGHARAALPDLPEPQLEAEPEDVLHSLAALAPRAPAVVRAATERTRFRGQAIALVAEVARASARGEAPAGALWARSSGCGMRVEGLNTAGVSCGMGHVPELGRRFLYFYTKP